MLLSVVVLGLALPVRTVELTPEQLTKPVRILCPAGQTTRIVFPERALSVKQLPGTREALGLSLVAWKPRAVVELSPTSAPAKGTVDFRGPGLRLTLVVEVVSAGTGAEIRLSLAPEKGAASAPTPSSVAKTGPGDADADPARTGEPEPEVVVLRPVWVAPSPEASAAPSPAPSAVSDPTPAFDAAALALAQPQRIGREEGLPGQRPIVLEDALRGRTLVWLRFRIRGGAKSRVTQVSWERGEVKSVLIEADGPDLRVVVQLPRSHVSSSTRVELRVDNRAYKFPVSAPWFSSFLRSLF